MLVFRIITIASIVVGEWYMLTHPPKQQTQHTVKPHVVYIQVQQRGLRTGQFVKVNRGKPM